jgi:hypothetical protein
MSLMNMMKTNAVMKREFGGDFIRQNTKDRMLNANDMLNIWNRDNPTNQKRIQHYFDNKSTHEFMEAILVELNLNNRNSGELKKSNLYSTKKGKYGGTWMNEYLFIDFAMWLNPQFRAKVVIWVSDQLIVNRVQAAGMYKELSSAMNNNFKDPDYGTVAKAMNLIVFGKHESGIRNTGTESQLVELRDIEIKMEFAISSGFIKSQEELLSQLRTIWHKKNPSNELVA